MFNNGSPKKRKNCESTVDKNELPSGSKRTRQNISPSTGKPWQNKSMTRVREIIKREFSHEMKMKESQLDQIDDCLEEAHTALNRLRYAIVAEYYTKQEQPQLMIEATKILQNNAKSSANQSDIQIAMHPSLKKIIGKRPTNLEDIMKVCPKRAAAQNAKSGIFSTAVAKRKEDRLRQKTSGDQVHVNENDRINIKQEENKPSALTTSCRLEAPNSHKFNSYRNGNKSKHLFVVGNTSKYISNADSKVLGNISLTHKWLVYVQTKETDAPISKYISKVRFFLHPSYRPNDIIDIHAPPFQVARRGWGEFPMRIQLFFHEKFQQKPIQLIHRVVLDTSKSGRHTLGAETVMEVWLRDEQTTSYRNIKREETVTQTKSRPGCCTTTSAPYTSLANKPRTISLTSIKEPFDDNFMDFLNKIEETRTSICADIEKIQPTVMVNESLVLTPKSPLKTPPAQQSAYRTRSTSASTHNKSPNNIPKPIQDANAKLQQVVDPVVTSAIDFSTPRASNVVSTQKSKDAIIVSVNQRIPVTNTSNTAAEASPTGRVFNSVSGTVILPVTKPQQEGQPLIQNNPVSRNLQNFTQKTFFQKKAVKVIDAQGKVKTVQVLVASTNKVPSTTTHSDMPSKVSILPSTHRASVACGKLSTEPTAANLATTEPFIMRSTSFNLTSSTSSVAKTFSTKQTKALPVNIGSNENMPVSTSATKNLVFQREGKLYIIDPLQMKLKQQQKNQVSLLKPQIKQQSTITASIQSDHDYVPSPHRVQAIAPTVRKSATPQTHNVSMRHVYPHVLKAQDLLQLRRTQFEKRFHRLNFSSMRSAIEYLLRRLPLNVFDKESPAAAFPFACTAPQSFCNLTAFKQRSCEWLRAKFIARLQRSVETLQKLDSSKEELFWSTREIAVFARHFAFTPMTKPINVGSIAAASNADVTNANSKLESNTNQADISRLIKGELQNSQQPVEYETLSPSLGMRQWLESMQQQVKQGQELLNDEEIINIDNDTDNDDSEAKKTRSKDAVSSLSSPSTFESAKSTFSYLPSLARLETASQFVSDICKDFSIRLQPEEIVPGVVHPAAQTLLAHTLKVFVDRLLRQAIANQVHQIENQQHDSTFVNYFGLSAVDRCLTAQDIRKAITDCDELDFLTNRHMGVPDMKIQND